MFSMFSGKKDAPADDSAKPAEGTEAKPEEVKKEDSKEPVAAETSAEGKTMVPAPDVDVKANPSDVTKKEAEKQPRAR